MGGIRPAQAKGPWVGNNNSGGDLDEWWLEPALCFYDPTGGLPDLAPLAAMSWDSGPNPGTQTDADPYLNDNSDRPITLTDTSTY